MHNLRDSPSSPSRPPGMTTWWRPATGLAITILAASLTAAQAAQGQGSQTLKWSDVDTLTEVTTPEGTTSFAYDGDGHRVSKSDSAGNSLYIRGPAGNLIAEYDKASGEYTEYVYMGTRRVARVSSSGERRYYHADQVGTPMAITDSGGAAVWSGETLPFGEEVRNSDPQQDDALKFTGKELDEGSGLHYFGARYYDARVGRFISTDPVRGTPTSPQTMNRYAYSLNNPIVLLDPDGRYTQDFHEIMTTWAGVIVGLDRGTAAGIGAATNNVDHDPRSAPVYFDQRTLAAPDGSLRQESVFVVNSVGILKRHHFATPETLASLRGLAVADPFADLGAGRTPLGDYLHALQDSFSHSFRGVQHEKSHYPGEWKIAFGPNGHFLPGSGFDKTHTRPDLALQAFQATVEALVEILGASGPDVPADAYQYWIRSALACPKQDACRAGNLKEVDRLLQDYRRSAGNGGGNP